MTIASGILIPPATTQRLATKKDRPFLYKLYTVMRAQEMALTDFSDEEKEQFLRLQFRGQRQHYKRHYPEAVNNVILLNGRPIGRLLVADLGNEIRLLDIVFLPEVQNRGIGAHYLNQLQAKAQQANLPIILHVWQLNHAALRFYKRHGFRVIADFEAYIRLEWQPK